MNEITRRDTLKTFALSALALFAPKPICAEPEKKIFVVQNPLRHRGIMERLRQATDEARAIGCELDQICLTPDDFYEYTRTLQSLRRWANDPTPLFAGLPFHRYFFDSVPVFTGVPSLFEPKCSVVVCEPSHEPIPKYEARYVTRYIRVPD